jgi:hypothetical protein
MKKLLLSTAAVATLLTVALSPMSAFADVFVTASITKTKVVTVVETINIDKFVYVFVNAAYTLAGAAEADAIMNVTNSDNHITGQHVGLVDTVDDYRLYSDANITGSVNGGTGVAGINQDAGNMVNQGNVVSVAAIADEPDAFIDAQAETDQKNTFNTLVDSEGLDPNGGGGFAPRKTATISGSINTNAGIVDLNQNAGNANNQSNADAIGIALGGVLALSEAALGQVNAHNDVDEVQTVRRGLIENSIAGNTGIVKVNQATGNFNNPSLPTGHGRCKARRR